jgi:hypothetical protein
MTGKTARCGSAARREKRSRVTYPQRPTKDEFGFQERKCNLRTRPNLAVMQPHTFRKRPALSSSWTVKAVCGVVALLVDGRINEDKRANLEKMVRFCFQSEKRQRVGAAQIMIN